ncbi:MAG: beta-lactamase family protein, partial [Planctomycetes bacterium]|nr:beta-lactamase family protein [Planctomycetota bacterium]
MRVALGIILGLVGILPFSAQEPSAAEGLGFSPDPTESLTRLVEGRVAEGVAPGAVVLVGRGAGIASAVVVGDRSRQPETHALTRDTIFDLASLTKVLATTLSVMRLVEEGQVALEDPVIKYLPEFRGKGKEAITVESLLRHRGGLLPDNALADYAEGTQRAWERICALGLRADPDTHYIYTDVGFIVLGRLVEAVSGKPLDVYARDHVFLPLGMKDTRFVRKGIAVASSWRDRVAPTEPAPGAALPLQAVVHDPRARAMDGVAGHAGLFAPADDVARAAMMLARRGRLESGEAFLSEATWRLMVTAPEDLSDAERRGLGWDLRPAGESGHRPGGL